VPAPDVDRVTGVGFMANEGRVEDGGVNRKFVLNATEASVSPLSVCRLTVSVTYEPLGADNENSLADNPSSG